MFTLFLLIKLATMSRANCCMVELLLENYLACHYLSSRWAFGFKLMSIKVLQVLWSLRGHSPLGSLIQSLNIFPLFHFIISSDCFLMVHTTR